MKPVTPGRTKSDPPASRRAGVILLVMGVSGSGKSTVGSKLAQRLGWPFHDGDDYHSAANISKMSDGIPLTDEDRLPWLDRLATLISSLLDQGQSAVVACSALRERYRQVLIGQRRRNQIRLIYLKADAVLIHRRMKERQGHFMTVAMMQSQFDSLEEPLDALTISAHQPVESLVDRIVSSLALDRADERLPGYRGDTPG